MKSRKLRMCKSICDYFSDFHTLPVALSPLVLTEDALKSSQKYIVLFLEKEIIFLNSCAVFFLRVNSAFVGDYFQSWINTYLVHY